LAYDSIAAARKGLVDQFNRHNMGAPQSLDNRTHDEVYWSILPEAGKAVQNVGDLPCENRSGVSTETGHLRERQQSIKKIGSTR